MPEIDFVFDRNENDLEEAKDLIDTVRKFGFNGLTDYEKSRWNSGLKACRNASDLNRIGNACNIIGELLNLQINEKTDWDFIDIPTDEDIQSILDSVQNIRNEMAGYVSGMPDVPQNPINSINNMNNVEKILYDVYNVIGVISNDMQVCGDSFACSDNRLI